MLTSPTQQTETTAGTLCGAYNTNIGYYQSVKEFKTADFSVYLVCEITFLNSRTIKTYFQMLISSEIDNQ